MAHESVSSNEIAAFYDEFSTRLLRDYVDGNRRVNSAIRRVCESVDENHSRILDIGCGIGTTSHYYSQYESFVEVHGIDISPTNIEIANSLFQSPRVSFERVVVPKDAPPGQYDLVAMIDVYEHIRPQDRPALMRWIGSAMSPTGRLIMTFPSPLHQRFLAQNKPAELQIVDEIVELSDVLELSQSIEATVMRYEHETIWHTNDYIHVVLDRAPTYFASKGRRTRHRYIPWRLRRVFSPRLRQKKEREEHVKRILSQQRNPAF